MPTAPIQVYDYYLLISWLFLLFVSFDFLLRRTQFLSLSVSYTKKFINLITNRNGILELPQPPQRQMIQQNLDTNDPNLNHPHYE